MKTPRLFPVVEIITQPFRGKKRLSCVSLPTQEPETELSARKRRKYFNAVADRDIRDGSPEIASDLPNFPSVPDPGAVARDGSPRSPAVSDFAIDDSLSASVVDVAHSNYEENGRQPRSPFHVREGSISTDPLIYEIMDDELLEDDELIIRGETPLDGPSTSASDDSEGNDIPIRLLQDYTIYDMFTNEAVPLAELLYLKYTTKTYGASGIAKPWTDNQTEEDDDDNDTESESEAGMAETNSGERIKLSKILEFDVHHFSDETKRLDSKIYVRTAYAWYILDVPSAAYKFLFTPFWIQHQVFHLLVTASLNNPRITYDDFINSLAFNQDASERNIMADTLLGRDIAREDIESEDANAYIISTLPELCAQTEIRISRVPVIRTIFGPSGIDPDPGVAPPSRRSKFKSMSKSVSNKEKEVLKHRNATVVTPIVSRIAKDLFKGSLEVAGTSVFDSMDEGVAAEIDNIQAHHSDPKSMKWGNVVSQGAGLYYGSVIMDGVTYIVGDDVMVNPGEDENMTRARNAESEAAQSANSYANRLWFCRICYFFERVENGKKIKMFHGQWFTHGSKTILQETAHSKSLYLMNKCEDNPIASIFKKCKIKMMAPEDEEIPDDGQPDSNDFHCGLIWNDEDCDFLDLPNDSELQRLFALLPDDKPCFSCGIKIQKEEQEELRRIPHGFTQYGVKYHVHDFIYLRPLEHDGVLEIAQITRIKGVPTDPSISVRCFGRYDDFVVKQKNKKVPSSSKLISDERRLYLPNYTKKISLNRIDGVCYVRHLRDPDEIELWVKHDDHFYLNQASHEDGSLVAIDEDDLQTCIKCYDDRVEKLRRAQVLIRRNEPLRGLELFSGAGGLGTGMDMSGFVETRSAVEFSPSAASTYQANHPHTTVYCQDSSLLLKHAIETHEGKNPKPLVSNDEKSICKPMPRKDDVDFIYGGPPCQSFSHANHSPQADDIRSTLPGNMLSYAEHYNPTYFLLENVKGLLDYPLMSNTVRGGRGLEGGIKSGVVKFIMRTLIALGYQVRYKLLQAGQYGAPQGRLRVIFWGAKRGVQIPEFPVPVYAFPRGAHRCFLPTGEFMLPVSRSLVPGDHHQCAPLKPITVNDAIGDLPPFDWKNPHEIIRAKPRDKIEAATRLRELGIAQVSAVRDSKRGKAVLPGFPEDVVYASKPKNRYQRWIRQKMRGDSGARQKVEGHYTKIFGAKLVEATVTVPLRPLADHRDLPISLQPNHAKPGARQEKKSFYGRMDGDKHFKCAMTAVAPNLKGSWVLHPSQKRIISVRECARAQGFPDYYVFKSADGNPQTKVDNQTRQIGNAVPVPLALALGKSLGDALVKEWAVKEREGSPIV